MYGEAPHDRALHDQPLHALLDPGEAPLELDAVAPGEAEVEEHLLVHLDERGLEDEDTAATVGGGDGHYPRGDHLGVRDVRDK